MSATQGIILAVRRDAAAFAVLGELVDEKHRMRAAGLTAVVGDCPWCGGHGTLRLELGPRDYIRGRCAACRRGAMA